MDESKVFGEFPDGFRMSYKDLWNAGDPEDMEVHQKALDKLIAEHGGVYKMYWSEGGINA